MLKEARFRALEILRRTQISLSCSSKRCRFHLISALLKASQKEKWLYPTCAIRKGKKIGKVNVTSSKFSQKIQLLTKDFQKSIDLLKTCIDGALGKMALSNFCNHEKNNRKTKKILISLFSSADKIKQYQTTKYSSDA